MSDDTLLGILGIVVSIVIYLLELYQVGGRKKRAQLASRELIALLLKRIASGVVEISSDDLGPLLESKARQCRVRVADMLSRTQILNSIFAAIHENDFIKADERAEILRKLMPVFQQAERAEEIEMEGTYSLGFFKRSWASRGQGTGALVAALLSSAVGTLFAAMAILQGGVEDLRSSLPLLSSVFLLSMAAATVFWFTEKLRKPDPNGRGSFRSAADFEREVERTLVRRGILHKRAAPGSPFDFDAESRGERILVEAKAWAPGVPLQTLKSAIADLADAVRDRRADRGILVTPSGLSLPPGLQMDPRIRLMSLDEFQSNLDQATTGSIGPLRSLSMRRHGLAGSGKRPPTPTR